MTGHSYRHGERILARVSGQFLFPCCEEEPGTRLINPDFLRGVLFLFILLVPLAKAIAQPFLFDVPQQSADGALTSLADQADITVVFDFELVSQHQANAVEGVYSVPEAVSLLLEGTPLGFEFGASDHLVITQDNVSDEISTMGTSKKNNLMAVFAGFLVGSGAAQQVVAQDAPTVSRSLEEIVVTARKREESLQDVPVAITALTQTAIEDAGIDDLGDVLNNTVGMVYNERDGNRAQAYPGVRGIKSFTGGGDRVSTFVDAMPVAGSQATIQFIDVAGVEVYRGPQSAVFGRSVYAGALNYSLRQPSLDGQEGTLNAQIGQDGRSALSGYYTTDLIQDTLGVYLSASRDKSDGPGSVVSSDGYQMGSRDTEHYSLALAFQPTDQLDMTLRYSSTSLDDGPAPDYNLDPATDSNYVDSPTAGRAPLYYGELRYSDEPDLYRNFCVDDSNCITDPGWELERERLAFDADYSFDNGHSLTFRTFTSEDTVLDLDDQDNTNFTTGFVVNMGTDTYIDEEYYELVWTSPDDQRLRYTLGYSQYDYFNESVAYFVHPTSDRLTGVGSTPSVLTQTVKNKGVFAGLFYDITDDLTLSVEGRQQEDDISASDPDPTDENVPQSVSETFLPRIALNYALTDTVSLYAQYAKGVQPSTINTVAVAPLQRATAAALGEITVAGQTFDSAIPFLNDVLAVDEELLYNYEVGMKGTFLDGRLSLNAALFKIETEGYAETGNLFYFPDGGSAFDSNDVLAALEAYGAANNIAILDQTLSETALRVRGAVNIADLSSKGLELDGVYLLSDNWELAAQLTYLQAKFDNGCTPIGEDFGLELTELVLASGGTMACTDISGNDFPYIPNLQLGAAVTYTDQLDNGWDWFTRLDMRYEDEQYMDWFNAGYLPSSTKFNLRAGVDTGSLRIEAYVENLTDDRTPLGAQYEPARNEVQAYTGNGGPTNNTGLNVAIAYPREMGLKVSYSF